MSPVYTVNMVLTDIQFYLFFHSQKIPLQKKVLDSLLLPSPATNTTAAKKYNRNESPSTADPRKSSTITRVNASFSVNYVKMDHDLPDVRLL